MSLRRFWFLGFPLCLLPGLVFLGTQIRNEDGDPYLCKDCWIGGHHHHASECAPWRPIDRVCRAQFHYFATDPDGKGRKEFWRKDVSGLWGSPDQEGHRMGLVRLEEALADDHPAADLSLWGIPQPAYGYRLRSLLHEGEATALPTRFALCSYPVSAASGNWTYIADELGIIYRKALDPGYVPVRYPGDPAASGWKKFREVGR